MLLFDGVNNDFTTTFTVDTGTPASFLEDSLPTPFPQSHSLPIEDFDIDSGRLIVGDSGQVTIDFLIDGGKYEGEVALFSLNGMDELTGIDFIREAAARALDDPLLDPPRGHIIISDRTQGAKYNNNPGENRNWNRGSYSGPQTFDFASGDQLALMFVPDGTVEEVRNNPAAQGKTKPLFSIASLNPKAGLHIGQIAYGTTDGYTLALEDQSFEGASDRDYNDLIFQITGVTSTVTSLDKIIDPVQDWRKTSIGTDLIDYVSLPVAPNSDVKYRPHELLVKFPIESTDAEIAQLMAEYGASGVQWLVLPDKQSDSQLHQWRIVTFEPSVDILALQVQFAADTRIAAADLNVLLETATVPNDPAYGNQWALPKISAPAAWDITQGNEEIVVAVLDTGIDYEHPDLAQNIWKNTNEIADNDLDDDGNGYVDDYYGYDFSDGNTKPTGLDTYIYPAADIPRDSHGHGTHVAGVIGAATNNKLGISGVSPNVKLMPVQFLSDGSGSGTVAEAVEAIHYALKNEVDIINASFGGYLNDWGRLVLQDALLDALDEDVLVVTAAGNRQLTDVGGDGKRIGNGGDNDARPFYPASFDLPNVISVAATNQVDQLAAISNYGEKTVHLAAPGTNILSTLPTERRPNDKWEKQPKRAHYGSWSGTSMATPHVAGAAALMLSVNPTLSAGQQKQLLMGTVDPLESLNDKTVAGGRINLAKALQAAQVGPVVPTLEWVRRPRTSAHDRIWDVTTNDFGDVYVTGTTYGTLQGASNGNADGFIIKYDENGNQLWTRQFGTPELEIQGDIVTDSKGNIYLAGITAGSLEGENQGDRDAYLMKYDSNGNQVWVRQLGSILRDEGWPLAIDEDDNLYITGATRGNLATTNQGDYDVFIAKYDEAGNQLWLQQFGNERSEIIREITVKGNYIYAIGNIYNTYDDGEFEANFIAKYDTSGNQLWLKEYSPTDLAWQDGVIDRWLDGITVDDDGYIYASGGIGYSDGAGTALLTKIDQDGTSLWSRNFENSAKFTSLYDVSIRPEGGIYTAGWIADWDEANDNVYTQGDFLIANYASNGDLIWSTSFQSASFDSFLHMTLSHDGDIYLAGESGSGEQWWWSDEDDGVLVKFSPP